MSTVGDLLDALQGYDRRANLCVLVDTASAGETLMSAKEDTEFHLDRVEPIGCNLFDLQITIGVAR